MSHSLNYAAHLRNLHPSLLTAPTSRQIPLSSSSFYVLPLHPVARRTNHPVYLHVLPPNKFPARLHTPTSLVFSMARLYPALTRRPVSSSDGPGGIYVYRIPRYQSNRPKSHRRRRALARPEVKIGRAIDPPKRRKQWLRKCRGQRQIWWFYWHVPFAKKFETLLHKHFKLEGAWIRPEECEWCTVNHCEKFDCDKCGGRRGIIEVAEGYHALLGWPIDRRRLSN
ncbi:hypothetical protein B0H17DRAFT_1190549 [Mycena rosella]|uniref:Bacteriophage T5 Orf172 DNA-binding domain-containing protein n=1 Tax=Mycena rosella TaxID=1033263 RepID=A0AAD7MCN6_MYCRO|nr:hypothetical protein B0H17DRAFT_1190549 [Mycena rosella]